MLAPVATFILLYCLLYGAFGMASPFLPTFIQERGLAPELIGLMFGAGTAIRLISAPIAGRIADRSGALRLTLAACAVATAAAVMSYAAAASFWPLLAVTLLHSVALAPTTNLADALAVTAARRDRFEYGWVRGAGSAAFIAASIVSGWAVSRWGLVVILYLQAALMLAVPLAVTCVPAVAGAHEPAQRITRAGIADLLCLPAFQRVVLVAALVLGSHALHDTFSVIRWKAAGVSPQVISLLWSLAVVAEVAVFFLFGPWLLQRLGPAGALSLASVAGAVRWLVAATTTDVLVLSLIQPLHGVTFALLHLACMRLLARTVPVPLAATAQAIYGTVGIGATSALITVVSGWLYARLGAAAFGVMSALSLSALPIAHSLRNTSFLR